MKPLIFFAALCVVPAVLPLVACTPAAAAQPELLQHVNGIFRAHYAQAKAQALRDCGPIIVTGGDAPLTLVFDGHRQEATYIDALTNRLKAMAHIPLTLAVLVAGEGDTVIVLPEAKRQALNTFDEALAVVRKSLASDGFDATQLARQERILAASEAASVALLSRAGMRRADFETYVRSMTPLVMQNVDDAAQRMLDGINTRVSAWRTLLGDHWKDLRVVVMAPHMPRDGLMEGHYFARLLHDKGDEARLFFKEGNTDTDGGLDFLATHLVDSAASTTFFGDAKRLHRDVLADATTRYLDTMTLPKFP